jgi:hypothetical protein
LLINAGFNTRVERVRDVWSEAKLHALSPLGRRCIRPADRRVNIANLALARSNLRRKELSTRLAIGAARVQVAQH